MFFVKFFDFIVSVVCFVFLMVLVKRGMVYCFNVLIFLMKLFFVVFFLILWVCWISWILFFKSGRKWKFVIMLYVSFGESLYCWIRFSINKIGLVVKINIIDKVEKYKIWNLREMLIDILLLLIEIGLVWNKKLFGVVGIFLKIVVVYMYLNVKIKNGIVNKNYFFNEILVVNRIFVMMMI